MSDILYTFQKRDTANCMSNSASWEFEDLIPLPIEHESNPNSTTPDVVKPAPKNPIVANKNLGFSNLPEFPVVPTDVLNGVIKEDIDEDDFNELLNRFEDLKKNKD